MIKEQIGLCTMYNCDCMELMSTMSDKSIDLAIVDPPYGSGNHSMRNYKVHRGDYGKRIKRTGGGWGSKYDNKIKEWDIAPDQTYFDELFRVSKNQIIFGGNYFSLPINNNFIVWDKKLPYNFSMAMCEYIWTSIKGNAKIVSCVPQNPDRFHPTQKPVRLYKWLLSKYAKQGDRILDTHFGSGSIAVACNELGFELTASEIDQDYFYKSCLRIKETNKQKLIAFS